MLRLANKKGTFFVFIKLTSYIVFFFLIGSLIGIFFSASNGLISFGLANAMALMLLLRMKKTFFLPIITIIFLINLFINNIFNLSFSSAVIFTIANLIEISLCYKLLQLINTRPIAIHTFFITIKNLFAILFSCAIAVVFTWLYLTYIAANNSLSLQAVISWISADFFSLLVLIPAFFIPVTRTVPNSYLDLISSPHYDPVTHLINRKEFEHILKTHLQDNSSAPDTYHILCYMDLDRLRIINEIAGYEAGDALLLAMSKLISKNIRSTDILSRLGGDEFGLILPYCSLPAAQHIAQILLEEINSFQFSWHNKKYQVGLSIGLVVFYPGQIGLNDLIAHAEAACYSAQHQGRNKISIFSENDKEMAKYKSEIKILSELEQLIKGNRLTLYAQEIRPLIKNAEDKYYEILIRLIDAKGNIHLPGDFINVAERYNLISEIDQWVIKNALITHGEQIKNQQIHIALNLSVNSLKQPAFIDFLITMLQTTPIPKEKIGFEITETAAISNLENTGEFVRLIQSLGCTVALDDFGTGFSSFNYLKYCPVDYVKIDGGFVTAINKSDNDKIIVESINFVAHKFGAKTIAEAVESEDTLTILQEIGIDYAQGFALHRPEPLENLLKP